jgi:hypothetical protein
MAFLRTIDDSVTTLVRQHVNATYAVIENINPDP